MRDRKRLLLLLFGSLVMVASAAGAPATDSPWQLVDTAAIPTLTNSTCVVTYSNQRFAFSSDAFAAIWKTPASNPGAFGCLTFAQPPVSSSRLVDCARRQPRALERSRRGWNSVHLSRIGAASLRPATDCFCSCLLAAVLYNRNRVQQRCDLLSVVEHRWWYALMQIEIGFIHARFDSASWTAVKSWAWTDDLPMPLFFEFNNLLYGIKPDRQEICQSVDAGAIKRLP